MSKLPPKAKNKRSNRKDPRRLYRWTKLRTDYLRFHSSCQRCKYYKTETITSFQKLSVHHIIGVFKRLDLVFEWSNLLTLCVECHKHFDVLERTGREIEAEQEGKEIKQSE